MDTGRLLGPVAEWRPDCGIALRIFGDLGLYFHSTDGLRIFDFWRDDTVAELKLAVWGIPKSDRDRAI